MRTGLLLVCALLLNCTNVQHETKQPTHREAGVAGAESTPAKRAPAHRTRESSEAELRLINRLVGSPAFPEQLLPPNGADLTDADVKQFASYWLTQDSVYQFMLPELIPLLRMESPLGPPFVLEENTATRGRAFYFRGTPCKPSELVSVVPWWDVRGKVSICKKDYLPELKYDDELPDHPSCTHPKINKKVGHQTKCGCGEYLTGCAKDGTQAGLISESLRQEVLVTVEDLVRKRRPFSEVLTTADTIRSSLADRLYTAVSLAHGERPATEFFDADTRSPRPRPEGLHAGILSTPFVTITDSTFRVGWARVQESFLCVKVNSVRVAADKMFDHATNDTRWGANFALTKQEGCRSCHISLENAFVAFTTSLQSVTPVHYIGEAPTRTKFVMIGEETPRAEGPPTLEWMGRVISEQPEFYDCLAKRMVGLLYAGERRATPMVGELGTRFMKTKDLWDLFEQILTARVLGAPE